MKTLSLKKFEKAGCTVEEAARRIKLVALDVDGVLTNGLIGYTGESSFAGDVFEAERLVPALFDEEVELELRCPELVCLASPSGDDSYDKSRPAQHRDSRPVADMEELDFIRGSRVAD